MFKFVSQQRPLHLYVQEPVKDELPPLPDSSDDDYEEPTPAVSLDEVESVASLDMSPCGQLFRAAAAEVVRQIELDRDSEHTKSVELTSTGSTGELSFLDRIIVFRFLKSFSLSF